MGQKAWKLLGTVIIVLVCLACTAYGLRGCAIAIEREGSGIDGGSMPTGTSLPGGCALPGSERGQHFVRMVGASPAACCATVGAKFAKRRYNALVSSRLRSLTVAVRTE